MAKRKQIDETQEFQEVLKAYKLELKLVYEKSQDSFEKQLSYLSAGALGFSILYIENIIKDFDKCKYSWMLIISWILLTFTLVINLISHYIASRNNFKSIKEIDDGHYDSEKITKRINGINKLNNLTIGSFISGIFLLMTFIISNTMHNNIKTPNPDLQKGRTATPPPSLPKPQTGQNPTSPPKNPPSKPSK